MAVAGVVVAMVGVAIIAGGWEQAKVANGMAAAIRDSRALCRGIIKGCGLNVGGLGFT